MILWVASGEIELAFSIGKGNFWRVFLPLLLAAGLVFLMIASANLSWRDVAKSLTGFDFLSLFAIALCTVIFTLLSSWKWWLVMTRLSSQVQLSWLNALYLTAMGSVLSLFLMPQVAVMATRSIGAKYRYGKSAFSSISSTAFEQVFDLFPLMVLALVTVVSLLSGWSVLPWLWATCGLAILSSGIMVLFVRPVFNGIAAFLGFIPFQFAHKVRSQVHSLTSDQNSELLRTSFTAQMLVISYTRFAFIFLRAWLIIHASGIAVDFFQFAQSFSLVRIAGLMAFTPGSLGITEWSWTGMLAYFSIPQAQAAAFAITNRVLNSASTLVAFAFVWIICRLLGAHLYGAPSRAPGA